MAFSKDRNAEEEAKTAYAIPKDNHEYKRAGLS
jgi:hypothetical protein